MNKKVIYISLLTTTLSGADWTWRDWLLETCGSVVWAPERLPGFAGGVSNATPLFCSRNVRQTPQSQKGTLALRCKLRPKHLSLQPALTSDVEAGPHSRLYHLKSTEENTFYIFSALQRLKGIIHHDSASGQQPTFVNSFLSSLMHCVDIIDYSDKSHNYRLINIYTDI